MPPSPFLHLVTTQQVLRRGPSIGLCVAETWSNEAWAHSAGPHGSHGCSTLFGNLCAKLASVGGLAHDLDARIKLLYTEKAQPINQLLPSGNERTTSIAFRGQRGLASKGHLLAHAQKHTKGRRILHHRHHRPLWLCRQQGPRSPPSTQQPWLGTRSLAVHQFILPVPLHHRPQ